MRNDTLLQKKKVTRKMIFKRAEKYVQEYRANEKALVRSRRQAKNNGNFFIEDMPKVLLVVRVRGYHTFHTHFIPSLLMRSLCLCMLFCPRGAGL